MQLDIAHHIGARHRVVHEAGGEQLPRFPVIGDLLHQDLPDPLGEPAVHLALEGQRVDYRADIVDDDIVDQADRAGLGIDLDLADVTGAGDTVIAVFTLAIAAGATYLEAAHLANYAGGIAVMKRRTATVTRRELEAALRREATALR